MRFSGLKIDSAAPNDAVDFCLLCALIKDVSFQFLSAQKRTFLSALSACDHFAMRWVRNQTVAGNDVRSDLGRKSLLRMRCRRPNSDRESQRRVDLRHIAGGVRSAGHRRLSLGRQIAHADAVSRCRPLWPAGLATDQGQQTACRAALRHD